MAERRVRSRPAQRRSVRDPPSGWSSAQAVALLAQGYSVNRVVEVTGFDRKWVRLQAARLAGSDVPDDEVDAGPV